MVDALRAVINGVLICTSHMRSPWKVWSPALTLPAVLDYTWEGNPPMVPFWEIDKKLR
jgi:hypothetical protein